MFGLGGTDKNLVVSKPVEVYHSSLCMCSLCVLMLAHVSVQKALAYLKRAAAEDYATASALIGRVSTMCRICE